MRGTRLGVLTALAAALVAAVAATMAGSATNTRTVDVGTRHASATVERQTLPVEAVTPSMSGIRLGAARQASHAGASAATGMHTMAVGVDPPLLTTRLMPVLDDFNGVYRFRQFTLRALGQHAEVWVQSNATDGQGQSGLNFPPGDCRNDGVRNVVSDTQLQSLVTEFDNNIYPKESATFSVPATRDGTNAIAPFSDYTGDGNKIVVLVSNVRDDNFFDTNNAHKLTYIAGFFSSQVDDFLDRNVMSIDAFDWLHRTGANPIDNASDDPCTSAPSRPHLYEGVFAHEYQHLLESYEDPDEVNWINEGLSDWAQTLVGYVNPSVPITDRGFDSHIQCFLGWLSVQTPVNPIPRPECGPENSLTRWLDLGDPFVLADYGAAYSMMELLQGRYGNDFMTALHRDDGDGLAGLQDVLDARGGPKGHGPKGPNGPHGKDMAQDIVHDWLLAAALDGLVDGDKYHLKGGPVKKKDITVKTLDSVVNWDNPHAYSAPGAPSNGADYVRLRDAAGNYLSGDDIDSISFSASKALPSQPVEWKIDPNPPGATGNPALYSDFDDLRDEAIVHEITVGSGAAANLSFKALWNEEEGWDFGFAQISDDGGATYQSLTCTDTTLEHNVDALPTAVDNVPGFTGYSGGFKLENCSLAAYANKTVLLAFRAFNDPATLGAEGVTIPPGFWVDDVKVGTTPISDGSSLTGWRSFTQVKPNTVAGFTIWIVSIEDKKKGGEVTVKPLELNADFSVKGKVKVNKLVDKKAGFVGAIVAYDDPAETSFQYAPYTLTVNGVVQPGGS